MAGASTRSRRSSARPGAPRSCCSLRDGEDDLLNGYRLRSIIQKYSDHISLPILMPQETTGDGQDAGQPAGEVTVNQASALWSRPKSELSEPGLRRLLPAHHQRLHRPAGLRAQQDRGDV